MRVTGRLNGVHSELPDLDTVLRLEKIEQVCRPDISPERFDGSKIPIMSSGFRVLTAFVLGFIRR
jgi:hypothetical protein